SLVQIAAGGRGGQGIVSRVAKNRGMWARQEGKGKERGKKEARKRKKKEKKAERDRLRFRASGRGKLRSCSGRPAPPVHRAWCRAVRRWRWSRAAGQSPGGRDCRPR